MGSYIQTLVRSPLFMALYRALHPSCPGRISILSRGSFALDVKAVLARPNTTVGAVVATHSITEVWVPVAHFDALLDHNAVDKTSRVIDLAVSALAAEWRCAVALRVFPGSAGCKDIQTLVWLQEANTLSVDYQISDGGKERRPSMPQ